MKAGEFQVIGVTFNNNPEKGNSYNLFAVTPFEEWERENSVGLKTINEWTRIDLSALRPNDVVRLRYGKGFKGMAVLVGYDMVKQADSK